MNLIKEQLLSWRKSSFDQRCNEVSHGEVFSLMFTICSLHLCMNI